MKAKGSAGRGWRRRLYARILPHPMDPKTLNALVHDREAAFYDDRFLIDYDARIGREVRGELTRVLGHPPRARRALDVACGTGYLAIGLAAAGLAEQVHATDLSPEMLRRTGHNARAAGAPVTLALADGERLPYDDAVFDLVVARGALHHLPSPLAALREMRRVMARGGVTVVLAEPTAEGERQVAAVVGLAVRAVEGARRLMRHRPDEQTALKHHWELASIAANLHTFSPEDLAELGDQAGFTDVSVGTASWAWILVLGLNYYLAGEIEGLARNAAVRRGARALADAAARLDRGVAERVLPPRWLHTVQAVMR